MAKRLTDIAIRNLRARETQYEVPDGKGLYILVHISGKKRFCVRYRFLGRTRKLTLKAGISLAAARKAAADAMHEVEQGRDPGVTKQEAAEKAALAQRDTLAAVCEEYFARTGKNLRSRGQQEAALARHVYPTLGARQIATIQRKEIIRLLDKIEDTAGPRAADLALAYVGKIMAWFSIRDETFRSPIVRGMARLKPSERARSRILSDDELRAIWRCDMPGPFPALVRFLLLTAARRTEASRMQWDEVVDNGDWTLPASRNKVKVDLVRPLPPAALAVLDALPRIEGCPFVFTANGTRPFADYSGGKRDFDRACGVERWVLHDLRRTARSLMSRAGVPSDHAERCLGHVIGGVRGIYDRHEFYAEKKQAYEALAAQILCIVNPPEGDVVPFQRRERAGQP
jgi:integrase